MLGLTVRFRCRGFTLIELLVVVAIIALLISILLPSLAKAREQAKSLVCAAHLKELGNATTIWVTEAQGNKLKSNLGWGARALRSMGGQVKVFACPVDKDPSPRPAVIVYTEYQGRWYETTADGAFSYAELRPRTADQWTVGVDHFSEFGMVGSDWDYNDAEFKFTANAWEQAPVTVTFSASLRTRATDFAGGNSVDTSASGKTVPIPLMWGSYGISASGGLRGQPAGSVLLTDAKDWCVWPESLDELTNPSHPKPNTPEQLRANLQMANGGYPKGGKGGVTQANTYMRVAFRHGGRPTASFANVVERGEVRDGANVAFADTHVQRVSRSQLLDQVGMWHAPRKPGWSIGRF